MKSNKSSGKSETNKSTSKSETSKSISNKENNEYGLITIETNNLKQLSSTEQSPKSPIGAPKSPKSPKTPNSVIDTTTSAKASPKSFSSLSPKQTTLNQQLSPKLNN
jgi:hypothetical protein